MKKLFNIGMGLALCIGAALFTGCEKKPLDESEQLGNDYVETAFGMSLQMVAVEGGAFMMGATPEQGDDAGEREKPVHEVTLGGFYIGAYEVTQAQWKAVMGTTIEQQRDKQAEEWEHVGDVPMEWELYGVGDSYPMYYVNWTEAVEFCEKLSAQTGKTYRLPTEAEWEYAARGGKKNDGTKYAGSNDIDEVAWYGSETDNSNGQTHPVCQKKPNGLGIYDMSGNVWEWCQDRWNSDYYSVSPSVNPQGAVTGSSRVRRGGGWSSNARYCRVSIRNGYAPGNRDTDLGFRVVCSL